MMNEPKRYCFGSFIVAYFASYIDRHLICKAVEKHLYAPLTVFLNVLLNQSMLPDPEIFVLPFVFSLTHIIMRYTICSVPSCICTHSSAMKAPTHLFQVERPHKSFSFSPLSPLRSLRRSSAYLRGISPRTTTSLLLFF